MFKIQSVAVAIACLLAVSGCKDKKLENCMSACKKIQAEDEDECSGKNKKSCLADAEDKFESCSNICDMAVGKKSKRSRDDDDDDDKGKGKGKDEPKTPLSEADLDEQACEKSVADACKTAGTRHFLGKDGRSKDEAKGAGYFKKACDLGSVFGCEMYGRALDDGRGVPKDEAASNVVFKKACDQKAGGACRSLGLNTPAGDPTRLTLFAKACDLDDGLGCVGLAAAYLHGDAGIPKNLPKAKSLLEKACRLGQQSACEKAREIP